MAEGDAGAPTNAPPTISLPKSGGAIRGIGEKFAANPVTGTGSLSVPIATSAGRAGFGPQLSLSYDSGAPNGPFGLGWTVSPPSITRKTDKGLPRYDDALESDVYLLSGTEDLVPALRESAPGKWVPDVDERDGYSITRYRPRIEGLFARIERWVRHTDGDTYWRSISAENVTSVYGRTPASRIADPTEPRHVYSWLISETYDGHGNAAVYEYAAEDSTGVRETDPHERNRTDASRSANHYLKRVRYGNTVSRLVEPDLDALDWLFEVVFDYGEGHYEELPPDEEGRDFVRAVANAPKRRAWPLRQDPFSVYRPGFEVRTYRLCRRVLMFHHFPDELGAADTLVRSTDFGYEESPVGSFLVAARQSGYVRQQDGTYLRRSTVPVEFGYSKAVVQAMVRDVDPESLENLPVGLAMPAYRWADLDGEGAPGIVSELTGAWYYKRNLSPLASGSAPAPRFAPAELLGAVPAPGDLASGRQQLLDLGGDGSLDLVQLAPPLSGFFTRTAAEGWSRFEAFSSLPNVDWNDPELRFVDLTGDGNADALLTGDEVFHWYPSLAKAGYGPEEEVRQPPDEELGPRLVFADGTESIYLADMSGDGLADLVRIRNGAICYWPSLGYGRFGAKVTMDRSPTFAAADEFDQSRVRLADVDGSGTTDVIYLGRDAAQLYFNQAGNGWSAPEPLDLPPLDDVADVRVIDLFGNGTACIVWSSPLAAAAGRPMRFLDLMGGQKPHLLVRVANNLGAETHVQYAPSTRFFVADRLANRPWLTRLSFPVHVVERVETYDRLSRTRFVSRYAYRHGYFDGVEREFRGFGLVEQWDTEELSALEESAEFPAAVNVDEASYVPPVWTRTWFHTGAFLEDVPLSRQFEAEYFVEPGLDAAQRGALLLDDSVVLDGLDPEVTPEEAREAARALKGSLLRREVYALDGSEAAGRPYTVSERNYTLRRIQPRGANRHAVFLAHPRETLDLDYDRKLYPVGAERLADPRMAHTLTLATDEWGNVHRSVTAAYGRRLDDPDPALGADDREKQRRTQLTLVERSFTNAVVAADDWRAPALAEARTYELVGVAPSGAVAGVTNLFRFQELATAAAAAGDGAHDLPYEDVRAAGALPGAAYRRQVERVCSLYRRDDLTDLLPLRCLEPLGLPGESRKLALTAGLVAAVYGARVSDAMLAEGGYVHDAGDADWWIPTGSVYYSPGAADLPAQELAFAREHFFLSRRFRSPFGADTVVDYDAHDLLLVRSEDAAGNVVRSDGDYRVLQPALVTDPNGNRSAALYDALGAIAATAQMGKVGETLGDSLAGVEADLTDAALTAFLANPLGNPQALLGRATARIVHDLHAYERTRGSPNPTPATVCTLAREVHEADLAEGDPTPVQVSFAYSDGFGREIQKKMRAERGPLEDGGAVVDPRWIGTGWTVFDNKGKPVKSYEPFFSATTGFEFAPVKGVGATMFYDAAGRTVATLHPNKTWTKKVSDPWSEVTWDANDTVLVADPRTDPDVGGLFRRLPQGEYLPTWRDERAGGGRGGEEQRAAERAGAHAGTPARSYLDSLGRSIVTVADNGPAGTYATRIEYDLEGNRLSVTDARGRIAVRYTYDILGHRLRSDGIDAGTRWVLNDIEGKPLFGWDSLDRRTHMRYDLLRRPIEVRLSTSGGAEAVVVQTEYGEAQGDALNHRGRIFRQLDSAGSVTFEAYDFKGNLLRSSRRLAAWYRSDPDWSTAPAPDAESFTSSTTFDALNRPVAATSPDGSVTRGSYNVANLLERVDVNLRGAGAATSFVGNLEYNAKGQRTSCSYGNGTVVELTYDPLTFRVDRISARAADGTILQDQSYTYDPMANVTAVRDAAQQAIFFANQRATPHSDYVYDAIYRLVAADGREHAGQVGLPQPEWSDASRSNLPHPNDGLAMRRYLERFEYDEVGNVVRVVHSQGDLASPGATLWNRRYQYRPDSNRLISTSLPGEPDQPTYAASPGYAERYLYDADGNMRQLPHLTALDHQHQDRLRSADLGGGGKAFFVYDAGGQRVRTVIERLDGTRRKERIYLGSLELYREYAANGQDVTLERETLHVRDDARRVALVETRTRGDDGSPERLIRFQLTNRLDSVSLELDETGALVSYEEYHPYGSTAYQGVRAALGASPKRYRFTGKERDEGTGFYYHGARYCAPWLGRWTTCDPPGVSDGVSAYVYARDNPVGYSDPAGTQSQPKSYDIGPFRLGNFQLSGIEPLHAELQLDLGDLFSGGTIGITSANAGGAVRLTSDVSIPALGLSGGVGSYRLGLEALRISNGIATADISGSAVLHSGPVTLDLSVSGYGETFVPRISLSNWRENLDSTVSNFRGWAGVFGRVDVGGLTVGAFSLSADARGTEGALDFHASVGIPSLGTGPATVIGGASATGTFSGSTYSLSGNFHAALPPVAVAWGTLSLDSSQGFRAQGNYFGPLVGPLGLTPKIDPFERFRPPSLTATRSTDPSTISPRLFDPPGYSGAAAGTIGVFEPGFALGYSHFATSSTGSSIFSVGFAPRASVQDYNLEHPPLPFPLGAVPGLDTVLYHQSTSTPAGWYVGASLTLTR